MHGYFLSFILIFFSFIFLSISSCPNGSLEWKSNCYTFNSAVSGFPKAEMACLENGGHLTSIHDAFANDIIRQNAPDYFHQSNITDFWVGANSSIDSKIWEWTDGSGFDFKDWKKGEPKNATGTNCATVSMNDGYWSAEDCFKLKPFVCIISSGASATTTLPVTTASSPTITSTKIVLTSSSTFTLTTSLKFSTTPSTKSVPSTPTISSTVPLTTSPITLSKPSTTTTKALSTTSSTVPHIIPSTSTSRPSTPLISTKISASTTSSTHLTTSSAITNASCPSGWDYFNLTKSCYYNILMYQDWQSSEKYCKSFGAHLASIHSYDENVFVNGYDFGYYLAVWIGLSSIDNGTTWQWTDDTPFDYVLWDSNEPVIQYIEKNCVVLLNSDNSGHGYFDVNPCNSLRNAVCKKVLY